MPYLKFTKRSRIENHFTTTLIKSLVIEDEKTPIRSVKRITAIEPIAAMNWLSVREEIKSPIAIRDIAMQETPIKLEIISAEFTSPYLETGMRLSSESKNVVSKSVSAAKNLAKMILKSETGAVKRICSVLVLLSSLRSLMVRIGMRMMKKNIMIKK